MNNYSTLTEGLFEAEELDPALLYEYKEIRKEIKQMLVAWSFEYENN